ncbi:MAG: hypothetical protein QM661_12960 [Solimonas sp.]
MNQANRMHRWTLGAAALLLAPGLALAYDYNDLEGGYLHRDQAGDESGLRIGGSFDVLSPVAIFAEYDDVDEFSQLSVGGLYHTPLTRDIDLNLGVSIEQFDHDRGGDDTGFGLRGGIRWTVPNTRLELDPELRYVDIDHDKADGVSVRLGALYPLTGVLDLQGGVQTGQDDRFDLGVCYNFGPRTYVR